MVQTPGLCFSRAPDTLAKHLFARIEHNMEHGESGIAQARDYLLQVGADQDGLWRDQMLAGEPRKGKTTATPTTDRD